MAPQLTDEEQRWLRGEAGPARQLAVRLLVAAAEAAQVEEFVAIESAHINSCHYSGRLSLDFAELLAADDVRFAVPTHTNASLIACDTPELRPADQHQEAVGGATRLMTIYESLGCTSMWTCAPYQQSDGRPGFGQQVVGSESNAVSFYNSVLGARTNKYGDVLDVAAAIVGRVPLAGLHTDEGRIATHLVRVDLPASELQDSTLPHLVGTLVGEKVADRIPVIDGLPELDEDGLKAIAAAAATAGSVAMFHASGRTPEAPTVDQACGNRTPLATTTIRQDDVDDVRARLSSVSHGPIDTVCLGTPHFSVTEFVTLAEQLAGRRIADSVRMLVTTSRAVLLELGLRGLDTELAASGVELIADTCTYYPPRPSRLGSTVMTNSAKWAYYAPGMLDVEIAFGGLADCVESAVAGIVTRTGER